MICEVSENLGVHVNDNVQLVDIIL